jgi:oleandomycin transport system permease protein
MMSYRSRSRAPRSPTLDDARLAQVFVNANPVTALIDAARGLMLGGEVAGPVLRSIVWMVAIQAVFAPLAIARYRRRV